MLKGYKTLAFGLLVAIAPGALTYLAGVDWTAIGVSPGVAAAIGAVIIALRAVTNTTLGKSSAWMLVVGSGLLLSACAPTGLSTTLSGVSAAMAVADKVGSVAQSTLAAAGAACSWAEPRAQAAVAAAQAASAQAATLAASSKSYLDGVCLNLTPGNTNIDSGTPSWEATVVTGLEALAAL